MSVIDEVLNFAEALDSDTGTIEARAELAALLAELSEYRTLRPVACNRQCFERGWKAAQEAAAKILFDAAEYARREWIRTSNGRDTSSAYLLELNCEYAMRDSIRALQPPTNCDGCNPLEPDADAEPKCQHEYQTGVGQWTICNSCGEKV